MVMLPVWDNTISQQIIEPRIEQDWINARRKETNKIER